jgi:hypothetical protein
LRPAANKKSRKRRRNKATPGQNVSSPTIHRRAASLGAPIVHTPPSN